MNVHELPLILFTILAQMSVGAFVVLGVVQVVTRARFGRTAVDHITDPALYAIGPILVFGLIASMTHLGTPLNALNTLRHLDSSWLSREIVFGVAFAGLGFLFAVLQWFRWGPPALRQALAALTAVVGLGLVWVMSMVYASLPTVPVWYHWTTPAQFFLTTFLLGTLAVGAALMSATMWRERGLHMYWLERSAPVRRLTAWRRTAGVDTPAPGPATARESADLLATTLRGLAMATVGLLGTELVVIVLQQLSLASDPAMPAVSTAAYTSGWFVARLVLLVLGAGLLGIFLYRLVAGGSPGQRTGTTPSPSARASLQLVAVVATAAFLTVLSSELIGRSIFYTAMARIGM